MRESRGDSPAMANTFVGRGGDSDKRVCMPGCWATASPHVAPHEGARGWGSRRRWHAQMRKPALGLVQGEADNFVSSLAFGNMLVDHCAISGLFPILCLGPFLGLYQTKPLQQDRAKRLVRPLQDKMY